MLLKMYCKNMTGKQTIGVGQILMAIGLGCTSGTLLLNRFAHVSDFLLGFLTGLGIVAMVMSILFNIRGLRMQREGK